MTSEDARRDVLMSARKLVAAEEAWFKAVNQLHESIAAAVEAGVTPWSLSREAAQGGVLDLTAAQVAKLSENAPTELRKPLRLIDLS